MANTVKLKRSAVPSKVPTTADLSLGELAINTYDGKAFMKQDNGTETVVQLGDVIGVSSATDNTIPVFDGTSGKIIKNTNVGIDANDNVTNVAGMVFDTSPLVPPTSEGSLYWDSADSIQTLNMIMAGGAVVQQIGQEQYFRIKASGAISNGNLIMFAGTVGASGGLIGAKATGLTPSMASYVMGIATEDIADNGWGYVTNFGLVRNIDTTGTAVGETWADGDILYYNSSVAGGLTKTIPAAPVAKVQVCAVVHAASNGSLFVRPSFGGFLGQYEGDVSIGTYASGQLLIRDQTNQKWVNATLTAGDNVTITNGNGTITIAASGGGGGSSNPTVYTYDTVNVGSNSYRYKKLGTITRTASTDAGAVYIEMSMVAPNSTWTMEQKQINLAFSPNTSSYVTGSYINIYSSGSGQVFRVKYVDALNAELWTLEYPVYVSGVYKYKEFNYAVTLPSAGFSYAASSDAPTTTFSGTYATINASYVYYATYAVSATSASSLSTPYVASITAGDGIAITQPTPNNFVISAVGSGGANWYSETGLSGAVNQNLDFPSGYTQSPTTTGVLNIKEATDGGYQQPPFTTDFGGGLYMLSSNDFQYVTSPQAIAAIPPSAGFAYSYLMLPETDSYTFFASGAISTTGFDATASMPWFSPASAKFHAAIEIIGGDYTSAITASSNVTINGNYYNLYQNITVVFLTCSDISTIELLAQGFQFMFTSTTYIGAINGTAWYSY